MTKTEVKILQELIHTEIAFIKRAVNSGDKALVLMLVERVEVDFRVLLSALTE